MAFFGPKNYFHHFQSFSLKAKRFVYSSHGAMGPLRLSDKESREALEETQNFDTERLDHRLEKPQNLALSYIQLGVRDDLFTAVNDNSLGALGKRILDERVHERLKEHVAHELHHKYEHEHSVFERWKMRLGFGMDIGKKLVDEFGQNKDVNQIKAHLKPAILAKLTTLTDAQRDDILHQLGKVSTPPGTPPSPADLCDIIMASTATQLKNLKKAVDPVTKKPLLDGVKEIDRLSTLRKYEIQETAKILNPERFNTKRLQKVEYDLRTAAPPDSPKAKIYKLLSGDILKKDALFELEENAPNKALLADLEYRIEVDGEDEVLKLVEKVKGKLPSIEEHKKEGDKDEPKSVKDKETVKSRSEAFVSEMPHLKAAYAQAAVLQQSLEEAASLKKDAEDAKARARAPGGTPLKKDDETKLLAQVADAQKQLTALRTKQSELFGQINNLEANLIIHAADFIGILDNTKIEDKDGSKNLYILKEQFLKLQPSTVDEIFPPSGTTPPPSATPPKTFKDFITTTASQIFLQKVKKEAEKYSENIKPKMRVDSHQLLFMFRQIDFEKRGTTNPEMNARYANISANLAIADANSAQTEAAINTKVLDTMLPDWRGKLRRAQQWRDTHFFDSDIFTAQQSIELVASSDHSLEFLRDLDQYSSVNDMREAVRKHGGISSAKLEEAYVALEKILAGYDELDHHKNIQLKDSDWPIVARLINNLKLLRIEKVSREAADKILHPSEENKKKSKAQLMIEVISEQEKVEKEEAKTLSERIGNFFRRFWSKTLKQDYMSQAKKAIEYGKEHGLSREEVKHSPEAKGIPDIFWKVAKGALFADEAFEISSKVAKWIGRKTKSGASSAVSTVAEHTGKALGTAARGVKEAIKFTAWTVPTTIIKAPFQLTAWTAKTALKAATLPFAMMWKICKPRTVQELAAERAAYDAKKARERAEWDARKARRAAKHQKKGGEHGNHGNHDASHSKPANDNHGGHGEESDSHGHVEAA